MQPLEQAAAYLAQYWSQVFAKGLTAQMAFDHLLAFVPANLPEQSRELTVADFKAVLLCYTSSAPGPDGIPYGALALIADSFAEVMFNIYQG